MEVEGLSRGELPMSKRRILVVEDDCTLASQYRSALAFAGFDVDVASDGLSALENIDTDHPDLVVMELKMPQIGAEAVLSEAAATPDTSHIPFIVLMGTEAAIPGLRASVVLQKPCPPSDLVALVERHLR
jgi:DNA-binding response OmpR family regulator